MDEESNFPTILCLIIVIAIIIMLLYFRKGIYERFANPNENHNDMDNDDIDYFHF